MATLNVNLDMIAVQMNEALDNARVYLVAYRYEPGAVKAVNILTLAAGVRAVCQTLIDSMRNDVKVNPHHIERFSDLYVAADEVIKQFNSAVEVRPFVRQNGANAGAESVVLGEVPATPRKVIHTGKNGPSEKKSFVPYKNLTKEQRSPSRKLSDDEVRAIRVHFEGRPFDWKEAEQIGQMFDVAKVTVYKVVKRTTYSWVK